MKCRVAAAVEVLFCFFVEGTTIRLCNRSRSAKHSRSHLSHGEGLGEARCDMLRPNECRALND